MRNGSRRSFGFGFQQQPVGRISKEEFGQTQLDAIWITGRTEDWMGTDFRFSRSIRVRNSLYADGSPCPSACPTYEVVQVGDPGCLLFYFARQHASTAAGPFIPNPVGDNEVEPGVFSLFSQEYSCAVH